MSAIRDGRYPIKLDKERYMLFSLNVLDELQDKAGGYDQLDVFLSGKDLFKNLKWLLALLINEGAEEGEDPLTETQIGKMIHTGNLADIQSSIFKAFTKGTVGDNEKETDDTENDVKNARSGQE